MKSVAKKIINSFGYKVVNLKHTPESLASSNLEEDKVISRLTSKYPIKNKYCVDVGASDGINMSNTFRLFQLGWAGLAIECDDEKFYVLASALKKYNASLAKCFVTPDNVLDLFSTFEVPISFGLLSIDIDGYDYFVVQKILSKYKPKIIVAEINEKIPPPIMFTVKYKKNYFWDNSHFYGMSLSKLDNLCGANGYRLVDLHYNNAFYVRDNKAKCLTPEEAYCKGYKNKRDRLKKFYWNRDIENIYGLDTPEQVEFIKKLFAKYKNKYEIEISSNKVD